MIVAILGSGDAKKYPAGNKGRLLDKAKQAGLLVPPGMLVLDETFADVGRMQSGVSEVQTDGREFQSLAEVIVKNLDSSGSAPPYAVRSAFSAEDTHGSAMAGHFKSKLFVKADELSDALSEVWHSADQYDKDVRRDILVMSMVAAKNAGVAFSEREFEDDLVNHSVGTADALVSGHVEGESVSLPKLRTFENSLPESASLSDFLKRLQILLRDVRRVFGDGDWDIEWADDGIQCFLIQIRPITRASRRNEAFTLANHKEILPELPSPFMTSLIASCAHKLFDYYRNFDTELPTSRPFIEVFEGRPYINLSLLTEMMRIFGLPPTLVTRSIGGDDLGDDKVNTPRLIRKFPVLIKMGLSQFGSVGKAKTATEEMLRKTETKKRTVSECVDSVKWLYCAIVSNMQSLTAAMSAPLSILRRLGVLEEHNARHSTISSEMYLDLEPLRDFASKKTSIRDAVQQGLIPDDEEFRNLWDVYLKKHGHRGIYESDISRPRLREDPSWLLTTLTGSMPLRKGLPKRTLLGFLTAPIWWQASRTIKAREQVRYYSMLAMGRIRENLLDLTKSKFDTPDQLWLLSIDDACRLDHLEHFPQLEVQGAITRVEELKEFTLPDLVHRFDDLEQFKGSSEIASSNARLKGVSLTSGKISGAAAVMQEPPRAVPQHFSEEAIVLVARSVDAGWIPVFSSVKGVVVEIGGDLSHGSIILREIGLPSITNVRGATRIFQDGDRLLLDADAGVVSKATEETTPCAEK